MGFLTNLFRRQLNKTGVGATRAQHAFSALDGQATTLLIEYEGAPFRELEKQIVEILAPTVHPDGCRVILFCNANPPVPEAGEPTVSRLRFDTSSGMPCGISLQALVAYTSAKEDKGLPVYPIEKIGYWITTMRERRVLVVVCLA